MEARYLKEQLAIFRALDFLAPTLEVPRAYLGWIFSFGQSSGVSKPIV